MKTLTVICFAVCVVCVLAALVVALLLIWGAGAVVPLLKLFASIMALFLALLLILCVASLVSRIGRCDKKAGEQS